MKKQRKKITSIRPQTQIAILPMSSLPALLLSIHPLCVPFHLASAPNRWLACENHLLMLNWFDVTLRAVAVIAHFAPANVRT